MPAVTSRKRNAWKVAAVVVAILAVAALLVLAIKFPVAEWADSLEDRIERMDLAAGLTLFAAIYFVATLLLVPAWIFPIAAGAVFGFGWGSVVTMATAIGSSVTAFLIARYALRDHTRRLCKRYPVFGAVEKAMKKDGLKVVALMRLSPLLPFGAKNYLFGTTAVSLRDYTLGTIAGLLPGMLLKVYIGWAGRAAFGSEGGAVKWALLAAGIAATLGVSWLVGARVKARLAMA